MLRQLTRFSAWSIYMAILALYGFSLWALFEHRTDDTFWSLSETINIVRYSALQAGLSTLLATLIGLFTARAFFYLNFRGKLRLYRLISFAWALPSLVVIFALIGVWGKAGWLSQLFGILGIQWDSSLYGLHGILIAHLFLNIPLVMKYCLEGLNLIPSSQHQLAAQLNLRGWVYFRIVELPFLKGILPYAFSTVFLLCFTSFPIVLMLGGSPKYSTLEVAIYQAVTFEFDFAKAVMLIMVQVVIGLLLQLVMDFTTRKAFRHTASSVTEETIWRASPKGIARVCLNVVLWAVSIMILLPMANVVWSAITVPDLIHHLTHPTLWQSVFFSLILSLIASLVSMSIVYLIALETRQLAYQQRKLCQSILAGITTYPLILPIFLLAVGLFLLLIETPLSQLHLLLLVGGCNGLMLLPFLYRLIYSAMWQSLISHDKLARSLGLSGWRRWWIVEKNALIRPLAQAFALAMSSSLGSFAVIAFFGSPEFSTLPYLLYQQLGSYRTDEAAVTALVLMLCALFPFLWIDQKENRK